MYKRLLIAKLTERPFTHTRSKSSPDPVAPGLYLQPSQETQPPSLIPDDIALELRRQGVFSRSCCEDHCEFLDRHRPRRMKQRHLPLISILRQQDYDKNEQHTMNLSFFEAVRRHDLSAIAKALDDGADINFPAHEGQTALEYCVCKWAFASDDVLDVRAPNQCTTTAEFLLLYKEVYVQYKFGKTCSILHLCMYMGATAEFMEPFLNVQNADIALNLQDRLGRTPLHYAAMCPVTGAYSMSQVQKLLANSPPDLRSFRDISNEDAESFADSIPAHQSVRASRLLARKEHNVLTGQPSTALHHFTPEHEPDSTDDLEVL